MKITFLGSGAASGIPMLYCDCRTCTHARKHRGRNIRKRCSYMINDDLLVDMGPDLSTACAMHNVHLINTKYALITHSHLDHFFTLNLKLHARIYHQNDAVPPIILVAPPSVMTLLNNSDTASVDINVRPRSVLPYDRVELPPYHVKAVKANHFPAIGDAVNYIIDDGKRRILIASDTGVYHDEVWGHLENLNLDVLIIECTRGLKSGHFEFHMNIEGVQFMLEKMRSIQAVTEHTSIYVTHFSHHFVPPHDELREILQGLGLYCVYDGLKIEI